MVKIFDSGTAQFYNNVTVDGSLTVAGWNRAKPYAAVLVQTTASVVSVTSFGYQTIATSNIARVGASSKAYQITFPTAHPLGSNFAVVARPYASSGTTWDGTNDFVLTSKADSGELR